MWTASGATGGWSASAKRDAHVDTSRIRDTLEVRGWETGIHSRRVEGFVFRRAGGVNPRFCVAPK